VGVNPLLFGFATWNSSVDLILSTVSVVLFPTFYPNSLYFVTSSTAKFPVVINVKLKRLHWKNYSQITFPQQLNRDLGCSMLYFSHRLMMFVHYLVYMLLHNYLQGTFTPLADTTPAIGWLFLLLLPDSGHIIDVTTPICCLSGLCKSWHSKVCVSKWINYRFSSTSLERHFWSCLEMHHGQRLTRTSCSL